MTAPTGSRLGDGNLRGTHGSILALGGADVSTRLDDVVPGAREARLAAHSDREIAVRDGRSRNQGHVA
ncbi:hypothetical protein ACIQ6K_06150 [Streptomyces sp. NPDC096354]|uniref:hypothetical protein n=1 Tax=Streptomyces sp. NPDC096354 TaxID=3366088 RepID=UPI003814FE14